MTFAYKKKGKQRQVVAQSSVLHDMACDPKIGATHVVTEVKTGFNAFLLFEAKSTKQNTKKKMGGRMRVVIKSIPSFQLEGEAGIQMTEDEKKLAETLTFKFYGDTTVDPPPATFQDAVKVYKSLPEKSIQDERVVSYSIAPLSLYCDKASNVLIAIQNANVEYISQMMMDFNEVEKFIRKLKNTRLALDFQRYRRILLDLETRFEGKRGYFTAKIQELLPKIRASKADPMELTKLLQEYNASPFEKEKFLTLLNTRQKEIETAEYIIYHPRLPTSMFINLDHTGDMSKCLIDHDYAVVYGLEIMPGTNPNDLGEKYENGTLDESKKWFMDELKVGKNRPLMNDFIKLNENNKESSASICFMVSVHRKGHSGKEFQLSLLKEGNMIVEDFRAPQVIWKMEHVEKGVNEATLKIHHNKDNKLGLASSYYQLSASYESIGTDVSIFRSKMIYN